MKISIAALLVYLGFFHCESALAASGNSEPDIPVWRQQLTVAVDEYMHTWTQQAKLSEQTRVNYNMSVIDPRLKLTACEQTPTISTNQKFRAGKLTLKTECTAPHPWKLYVSVQIERLHPVVVTTTSILRNSILAKHNLELRPANIDLLNYGYFTSIAEVSGMISKRALPQGRPLAPGQLTPPKVISKGDTVLIEASNNRISVKMHGVAMSNGRKGQQITVKNLNSQRMVRAEVAGAGIVKVPL